MSSQNKTLVFSSFFAGKEQRLRSWVEMKNFSNNISPFPIQKVSISDLFNDVYLIFKQFLKSLQCFLYVFMMECLLSVVTDWKRKCWKLCKSNSKIMIRLNRTGGCNTLRQTKHYIKWKHVSSAEFWSSKIFDHLESCCVTCVRDAHRESCIALTLI